MTNFGKTELEALALVEPMNGNHGIRDTEKKGSKAKGRFLTTVWVNLASWPGAITRSYRRFYEREVANTMLVAMPDRTLRDIGISRSEINAGLIGMKANFANANSVPAGKDKSHRLTS